MRKVYQTVVDKGKGNCMQAAVASLLDLELDKVPDFNSFGEEWGIVWYDFWKEQGFNDYPVQIQRFRQGTEMLKKIAKFDKGVNGFFYATVNSQTFEDVTHAVVVDSDLNIVHDPNPNQKCINLTPEDVLSILVMNDMIIGKTGKLFTSEEWENTTEEERDLNTYKATLE